MTFRPSIAQSLLILISTAAAHASTLGTFTFDDSLFGSTLAESDSGVLRNANWLNVANANPGNPGALTGVGFTTGIANVGPEQVYTIGYGAPIINFGGADLGIVAARFSTNDFLLAVSTDGLTFSPYLTFAAADAVNGASNSYYFAGGGPFGANLFVNPVDLSAFGIAAGGSISAVRITSSTEGDLIRVAGLVNDTPEAEVVPEPSAASLLGLGLLTMLCIVTLRKQCRNR